MISWRKRIFTAGFMAFFPDVRVCVLLGINFSGIFGATFMPFEHTVKFTLRVILRILTRTKTALELKKMRERGYKTPRGLILTESKPSDTVFLLKHAEFPGFHCRKFEGGPLFASSLFFCIFGNITRNGGF